MNLDRLAYSGPYRKLNAHHSRDPLWHEEVDLSYAEHIAGGDTRIDGLGCATASAGKIHNGRRRRREKAPGACLEECSIGRIGCDGSDARTSSPDHNNAAWLSRIRLRINGPILIHGGRISGYHVMKDRRLGRSDKEYSQDNCALRCD